MIVRDLKILPYEFGEVLQLSLSERDSRTNALRIQFVVRLPLDRGNIEHYLTYSVSANKGVVANQIAREVFHLMNFLERRDWKDNLSSYSDFCDGTF